MVSIFAICFYAWKAYTFADASMQCTVNGYFDVLSAVHKFGYTDQSHLLWEFKRYHSMDIHNARIMAFKDVGNIQDVFV